MDETTKQVIYWTCVVINALITYRYCYWGGNNGIFLLMGIAWGPGGTFLIAVGLFFRYLENRFNIKIFNK